MKENDPIIPSSNNMHVEIAQTPYPNINYKANQNILSMKTTKILQHL